MSIFKKAVNTQAYLKLGMMGFAGSGKTHTATEVAIGLAKLMKERKLPQGDKPIMFLDTETGSDWVTPRIENAGLEIHTAKTRAFAVLCDAIREAEKNASVLIIDSITHFWKELLSSYEKERARQKGWKTYSLSFPDWAWLKGQWSEFTDLLVNSQLHIIMCGRASFEYDFFENDRGKKELYKSDIKMTAEKDTGFEPSLLLLMERHTNLETNKAYRTATVLKDRSTLIDGKVFENPTFENFLPHIEFLDLGGKHMGVDTEQTSQDLIPNESRAGEMKQLVKQVLEEIEGLMKQHYPSQTAHDKQRKIELLSDHFKTRSWKAVQSMPLEKMKEGLDSLCQELTGQLFYAPASAAGETDEDGIPF